MSRAFTEWITPITDRSQADVTRLVELIQLGYANMTDAQKAEFRSDMKGALNRSDLLRITNNLVIVLGELGDVVLRYFIVGNGTVASSTSAESIVGTFTVSGDDVPADLIDIPEIPNQPWYEELVDYVTYVRSRNYVTAQTPTPPVEPLNYFTKWNDIEKILRDAYSMIRNQIYNYAGGEIYSGETVGTALL